ncbi:MAG: hypothetical protein NZ898_04850 [Myxococcota bacterium]|nr:hypothetical protein [Myxococcota bacterium]MDW8362858.1 hypothetical protein [Myxococcales bacterium]
MASMPFARRLRDRIVASRAGRLWASLRNLGSGRLEVPTGLLRRNLFRACGVRDGCMMLERGCIALDATLADGRALRVRIAPLALRAAPRGACELVVRVDPPEHVSSDVGQALVTAFADVLARRLWALPQEDPPPQPVPFARERDAVRIDLRDVPELRRAMSTPWRRRWMDAVQPLGLRVEPECVVIDLELRSG